MFEGFLYQFLSSYLGNYVKDIQREQFRIGLWSGYVLLENVELRVEAFDYLQLPFAIKQGCVGKLRFQVPWKKLGWEPILIALEDVYICASPRDDVEWHPEASENRASAAKRAKLAAAELEKLSHCVSDGTLQKSFLAHISDRIIDNIQVTITNVHIQYLERSADSKVKLSFGLTLADLTVSNNDKRTSSSTGSAVVGKLRSNFVHKVLEIQELAIYWNSEKDCFDMPQALNKEGGLHHLLCPLNASLQLTVNRSKIRELGNPQYAVVVNIHDLNVRLDDNQYRTMLLLMDSFNLCRLREKYGHYRPANAEKKGTGWQQKWWQFAIKAVLFDVHERRRRSTWGFFNWCMEQRTLYVALYMDKLECLHHGDPIDESIVEQLKEMENNLDLEMILYYRALAENLLHSKDESRKDVVHVDTDSFEKTSSIFLQGQPNEGLMHHQRGWVSWLSLGIFGESGTLDASQLAGSISEDLVKDLYEATNFDPTSSTDSQDWPKGYSWLVVSFHLGQVVGRLHNLSSGMDLIHMVLQGAAMTFRMWKESASVAASLESIEVVDPSCQNPLFAQLLSFKTSQKGLPGLNGKSTSPSALLCTRDESNIRSITRAAQEGNHEQVAKVDAEIYFSHTDLDMTVAVNIEPLDFVYSPNSIISLTSFFDVPRPFQIIDMEMRSPKTCRLLSHGQTKYLFPCLKRVALQVCILKPTLVFPENLFAPGGTSMVVLLQSFHISSSIKKAVNSDIACTSPSEESVDNSSSHASQGNDGTIIDAETQRCWRSDNIEFNASSMNKFHVLVSVDKVLAIDQSSSWQGKVEDISSSFTFIDSFELNAMMYAYQAISDTISSKLKIFGSMPLLQAFASPKKLKTIKTVVDSITSIHEKAKFAQHLGDSFSHEFMYIDEASQACTSAESESENCKDHYSCPQNVMTSEENKSFAKFRSPENKSFAKDPAENVSCVLKLKFLVIEIAQDPTITDNTLHGTIPTWVTRLEDVQLRFTKNILQNNICLLSKDIVATNTYENSTSSSFASNSFLSLSGNQAKMNLVWGEICDPSRSTANISWDILQAEARNLQHHDVSKSSTKFVNVNFVAEMVHGSIKNLAEKDILVDIAMARAECVHVTYSLKEGCSETVSAKALGFSIYQVERSQRTKTLHELFCSRSNHEKDEEQRVFFHFMQATGARDLKVALPPTKIWVSVQQWNEVICAIQGIIPLFTSDNMNTRPSQSVHEGLPSNLTVGLSEKRTLPQASVTEDRNLTVLAAEYVNGIKSSDAFNYLKQESELSSGLQVKIEIPDLVFILKDFSEEASFGSESSEHDNQKLVVISVSVLVDKIWSRNHAVFLDALITNLEAVIKGTFQNEILKIPCFRMSSITIQGQFLLHSLVNEVLLVLNAESLESWFSFQILSFWRSFRFEALGREPSTTMDVSLEINAYLKSASLSINDGRWTRNMPMIELLLENVVLQSAWRMQHVEISLATHLRADYYNLQKVAQEPLLESWHLSCAVSKDYKLESILTARPLTKINVSSSSPMNINITESMVQAIVQTVEMIEDLGSCGYSDEKRSNSNSEDSSSKLAPLRYSPYWFENDTGVPVTYWPVENHQERLQSYLSINKKNVVEPGCSVRLHTEQAFEPLSHDMQTCWPTAEDTRHSLGWNLHRQICFQLQGASKPSPPMSIDLLGCRAFKVVFANSLASSDNGLQIQKTSESIQEIQAEYEIKSLESKNFFSTFAVLEVTTQGSSRLVRLHSKVSLANATSTPLEVRFDIPFGVSPKILDLVMPGQATFLPIHLAETGRIRWRPYGSSYLWSEAQSLSTMISSPHVRPVVCYPVHPSSKGSFKCCMNINQESISVTEARMSGSLISLNSSLLEEKNGNHGSFTIKRVQKPPSVESFYGFEEKLEGCKICTLTLVAPLLIKNFLTCPLEISIENGAGVSLTLSAPEEDIAFVYDVDVGHDLAIKISAAGYMPASLNFRLPSLVMDEAQKKNHHDTTVVAVVSIMLHPENGAGSSLHLLVEKVFDAISGARILCFSVPYWLYNCTPLDIVIMDGDVDVHHGKEILLSGTTANRSHDKEMANSFRKQMIPEVVGLKTVLQSHKQSSYSSANYHSKTLLGNPRHKGKFGKDAEVVPLMYSPPKGSEIIEHRLRARLVQTGQIHPAFKGAKDGLWSQAFSLSSPTGAATVTIPDPSSRGGCVISVNCAPVLEAYNGKTKMVTFQPRYVLVNACKKDIYFKQQGAGTSHILPMSSYSHLHLDDLSRTLLVSVRYDEHGWDWSGGFAPDLLGDTQVKMHNYVTGAREVIRVEVTIINTHAINEAYVGTAAGGHGTCLIIVTNDETGFMPYRIENFSMERLRFYQQKCDKMENSLHAYSYCDYAWDEPCQPHRLVIEIPGEGSLGAYVLDEIKEYSALSFPSRAEKPERRFVVVVRAEGPRRVLSVTDATIHLEKGLSSFGYSFGAHQSSQLLVKFTEEYVLNLAFVGFSLVDSSPQELAFASTKGVHLHIQQNQHLQKISFHAESCQVDNQLRHAVYPVMLSMSHGFSKPLGAEAGNEMNDNSFSDEELYKIKAKENVALNLVVSKWREAAGSIDCFQCICVRISPVMLELEEQHFWALVSFVKRLSSTAKRKSLFSSPSQHWLSEKQDTRKIKSEVAEGLNWNGLQLVRTANTSQSGWKAYIASDYIADMIQKQVVSAKEKRKVHIEILHIEPIDLTVSFSSALWSTKQHQRSVGQSLFWATRTLRRFMALADVEGAPVHLRQLMVTHSMANWSAIGGMISRHYTRQLLHEFYKVIGSADVLGNPMGFLRSLRVGVWDFFSSPVRSLVQNPKELVKSFREGTKSLLSHTVFAFSNAASQMSKAAQKGVAAFALDQDYITELRRQQEEGIESSIVNEFLEGLTGLLQLSVRGAERHGLPGIFSGAAAGALGIIARPASTMLGLSGKTFRSIRNLTRPSHFRRLRVRLPRYLHPISPLHPYSWEEAVGMAVLLEADGGRFRDEVYITCHQLSQSTKFVVLTKNMLIRVRNMPLTAAKGEATSSFGQEWYIELEAYIEDAMYIDVEGGETINIVLDMQKSLKSTKYRGVFDSNYKTSSALLRTEKFEFSTNASAKEFLIAVQAQIDLQKDGSSHFILSSRTLYGKNT